MIDALLPPDTDTRKPEEFERYARLMKAGIQVETVRKNMLTEVAEKKTGGAATLPKCGNSSGDVRLTRR